MDFHLSNMGVIPTSCKLLVLGKHCSNFHITSIQICALKQQSALHQNVSCLHV